MLIFIINLFFNLKKEKKITEKNNEIIKKNLDEKEYLLKEIHHRVKNNLQVITSLLSIQSMHIKDEKALNAINESKERVNAISILHQEIYTNEVLKHINAKTYLEKLINNLKKTFDTESKIKIITQIDNIYMDIDSLIPIGLITNELFTNSYKYGTTNNIPEFKFSFTKQNNSYVLEHCDNGKGYANIESIINKRDNIQTLGMKIIFLFCKKLNANLKFENNIGAKTTIIFKQ